MSYVIWSNVEQKYVAKGNERSFTDKLQNAAVYDTAESAAVDRCGSGEAVVSVEAAVRGLR